MWFSSTLLCHSHIHHIIIFWVFGLYCCDDSATISCTCKILPGFLSNFIPKIWKAWVQGTYACILSTNVRINLLGLSTVVLLKPFDYPSLLACCTCSLAARAINVDFINSCNISGLLDVPFRTQGDLPSSSSSPLLSESLIEMRKQARSHSHDLS